MKRTPKKLTRAEKIRRAKGKYEKVNTSSEQFAARKEKGTA